MSHLGANTNSLHCTLDWLGKTVLGLLVLIGALYASSYTFGWPNLPDPDKTYRRHHGIERQMEHGCMRAESL